MIIFFFRTGSKKVSGTICFHLFKGGRKSLYAQRLHTQTPYMHRRLFRNTKFTKIFVITNQGALWYDHFFIGDSTNVSNKGRLLVGT